MELGFGAGVRVEDDPEFRYELRVRWGVTDDLMLFCGGLGACGRIEAGGGQLLLGGGLRGFGFSSQDKFVAIPWASITWQQPVSTPVHLAFQARGDSFLSAERGALSGTVGGAGGLLWQPHERVIVSVGGAYQASWPHGSARDADHTVLLGSILGRPLQPQPAIQVRVYNGLALYASTRLALDATSGALISHQHMGGFSWSF